MEKQLDLRRFIELQRLLLLNSFASFTPRTYDLISGLSTMNLVDDATLHDPEKELENAMSLIKADRERYLGNKQKVSDRVNLRSTEREQRNATSLQLLEAID